jgi:hypothetical protein
MSGTQHRQKKASKPDRKTANCGGDNVGNLLSFAKWWIENHRPTEFTVKLRLINVIGLVLIVLILAMMDNVEQAKVVFDFLDGLSKILP